MDFGEDKKTPIKNEQTLSYIKDLEKKINALYDEAKVKLKAGDKAGAKHCLAKKKKLEEEIKQLENS